MSGVQTLDNCTCTFVLNTCGNSEKDRVDQLLRRTLLTWLIPWKVWARVFNLRTSSSAPISSPIWRTGRVHDKKTIAQEDKPGDCHHLEYRGRDKRLCARELELGKYLPTSRRIGEGYACHTSGQPMHCLCVVSLSEIFVFSPLLKLAVGLTVTDP